jgi:C4-dicarboxylate-specific signal transduction histidine kinase
MEREQRDILARMDRTANMEQLAGSIAHEINQPLTGILSNAQAAELLFKAGNWSSEEMAEIVTEIIADTKRAGDIIRSLRDLYRKKIDDFEPVDINAVVTETLRMLRSEFVIQRVEAGETLAHPLPPVRGNRTQLQQVLVNLLMNAVEAMRGMDEKDRRLRIRTEQKSGDVIVFVEDSGPGIDTGRIDRMFEPLASWKLGGTGMGLVISNSIIKAHGGCMWAENRPDGGARVGFSIPSPGEDQ